VCAPDGTFWVSEEFGPFLLHVAADGRLLELPVPFPGVRSSQNPFLKIGDQTQAERPTLAASRGPEGLAISPDPPRAAEPDRQPRQPDRRLGRARLPRRHRATSRPGLDQRAEGG